ncbi:MAG TPA: radical SAM protein [Acidobacteriota bacterium]|nr:radical SAM protein [Acidobacteriota bacterium]
MNPCELEIALFCRGLRIADESRSRVRQARRTRAGLGSGLELIIPGPLKPIWLNAPVEESFVERSPYLLCHSPQGFVIVDESSTRRYPVRIASIPDWYEDRTSRGAVMGQVGTLQGTYLGIYIGPVCRYWVRKPAVNCKFCTTGLNVGINETTKKSVRDVVETCLSAKRESGITFVHFNSGFQEGRDFKLARPFVEAVKRETGLLVGLQLVPQRDLSLYDQMIDLGVDHFSFCFEFMGEKAFRELCPGKEHTLGQETFFRAMEHTASKMGKGRVSGEIIAGVEPVEDTLRAIDLITDCGAFPTVCVFRPLRGSAMESYPPPRYQEMRIVFRHMIKSCLRKRIPIGVAPNIEVSLVVQPTDALYLLPPGLSSRAYRLYNGVLRTLMRPVFRQRMKPQEEAHDTRKPSR